MRNGSLPVMHCCLSSPKMATATRREDYLFLHKAVVETIYNLDNMLDPSQIDGLVLRLG